MNDDDIIKQRIAGKSVHAIAKAKRVSLARAKSAGWWPPHSFPEF
jgi:hypothetical protein